MAFNLKGLVAELRPGIAPTRPLKPALEINRNALLVCREDGSQWAPRWLEEQGFAAHRVGPDDDLVERIERERPDVIIVDIAMRDASGQRAIRAIKSAQPVPTLAICANSDEVKLALELKVTDIVRKPLDWQIISHRAALVANSIDSLEQLDIARDAMNKALSYAETARRTLARSTDKDAVTGLPNRKKFSQLVEQALTRPGRLAGEPLLLVLGLDRFQLINEAYGYAAGSRLLEQIARRLERTLTRTDLFAKNDGRLLTAAAGKLGGVRFALFVNHNASPDDMVRISKRLIEDLSRPFELDGRQVFVSASVGTAVPGQNEVTAERLLQNAESAMLEAKHRGTGISLYRAGEQGESDSFLQLEGLLRAAVAAKNFTVTYQPLVDVTTNKVVGAEALLRWHHPERGIISPARFVPVAEECGLMTRIGEGIIQTVCRDLRRWRDAGVAPRRVAINLSLCQLLRGDVLSTVQQALVQYRIDPSWLEFELSERGIVGGDPQVLEQLRGLRDLGIHLSIDDFGTGDAAISYLKNLPVDTVKIDASYVAGAVTSAKDAAIGCGVTALANGMGLKVVAEGVEDQQQLEIVRQWGCDEYQGFLFSPAVDADSFAKLLA